MSSSAPKQDEVLDSFSSLTVDAVRNQSKKGNPRKAKTKKEVADSWEDEGDTSDSEPEQRTPNVASPVVPSAPPPTPHVPHQESKAGWAAGGDGTWSASSREPDAGKRPEKTDAVARRMIAAGLGLKAPKQTEEQKAYQRSVREQEKKRREQEKIEEQRKLAEAEKAKASVWED
ncbi:hypothetical protein AAL_01717 [Moelleriella libera RCEF 2490]|uniref:Ubiquitin-like protein smt3 n=1 Tax=Moelleriella libera RCEF 2490 TaxID=1081109 RepID=A0A166RKZ1_9HYPO|nr:hypothetical protein AAL_01717 [Moelleriella libera RCEF 2490]